MMSWRRGSCDVASGSAVGCGHAVPAWGGGGAGWGGRRVAGDFGDGVTLGQTVDEMATPVASLSVEDLAGRREPPRGATLTGLPGVHFDHFGAIGRAPSRERQCRYG